MVAEMGRNGVGKVPMGEGKAMDLLELMSWSGVEWVGVEFVLVLLLAERMATCWGECFGWLVRQTEY